MQTFLPYPDFARSAAALDYRRLGKQRVEAKQIYLALTQPGYGWKSHPAVKMWTNYEMALLLYGSLICREWKKRGYKDSLLPWFEERGAGQIVEFPHWLFWNDKFCLSHQSNLVRKDPAFYRPLFPDVPDNLPYVWPVS